MKEVTRIHIAKIPYDIEILAKKEIQKYIDTLDLYANDKDLLQDIEIRITELLSERGISANGVITSDDVKAIRDQLGEPSDFMTDDNKIEPHIEMQNTANKKLFRNTDSAVLGGVLSGIAGYFNVNSLWLRLFTILLIPFTGGTVILAYLLLWIVIPPAKTAAEKLQMCGKPVNLESIKELNESNYNLNQERERASIVRRMIMLIIGIFSLGAAVSTLAFTIFAAFGIGHFGLFNGVLPNEKWAFVLAYILSIAAGLLLTSLFALGSYIAFSMKINKRIIISIAAIIIGGIASFSMAVGLVSYQSIQLNSQMQRQQKTEIISVPSGFSGVEKMTVNVKSMHIKYIVDNNYRMELTSLIDDDKPKIAMSEANLNISLMSTQSARWPQMQPTLKIYGPKLNSIIVNNGDVSYSANKQDISVETKGSNSSINLAAGIIDNLYVIAKDDSNFSATKATVENAIIDAQTGADVSLGVIKTVKISQPEACPVDSDTSISINTVSSGVMTYNGKELKAESHNSSCGSIDFDSINN